MPKPAPNLTWEDTVRKFAEQELMQKAGREREMDTVSVSTYATTSNTRWASDRDHAPSYASSVVSGVPEIRQKFMEPSEVRQTFMGPSEVRQTFAEPSEVRRTFAEPSEMRRTFAEPAEVRQTFAELSEVRQKFVESAEVSESRKKKAAERGAKKMPPALFKRRFCCHFPDVHQCKRGNKCAFAHSREEFRGSLLPAEEEHEGEHSADFYINRYKTLWCPIGIPHHWKNCVYSHNHLDIRRSPEIGYGPRQCPHWYNGNDKIAYQERCPDGVRCPYAHGAKELLYHPAYFKTAVCWDMMSPEGCPRSVLCAFHHSKEDCRVEAVKDMNYDYTKPLSAEQMRKLQQDFLTPPPSSFDEEGRLGRGSEQQKKPRPNAASATTTRPPPPPPPPPNFGSPTFNSPPGSKVTELVQGMDPAMLAMIQSGMLPTVTVPSIQACMFPQETAREEAQAPDSRISPPVVCPPGWICVRQPGDPTR
jgi:hypothetical protein